MKFTAFFLFAVSMHVGAAGFSQKISLNEKDVPLKKVFKEIESQSGYQFFYKEKLLKQAANITISVHNVSVQEALDKCFSGQPLTYAIIDKIIVIKQRPPSVGQKQMSDVPAPLPLLLKGLVKDEKGVPLPGVSIMIRGTQRGTTTDSNGEFIIDANAGDVIELSMVGYKTRAITVGSSTSLVIQMDIDVSTANDVVVVGYGTQKKENLTGSVDQVSKDVLENRPVTRLSQALQGVVGNLNILSNGTGGAPNATQSLNIRGYTGFGTRGTPLLVIDGVPGGDINTINPQDVESISVLKDQASTSIYGVDGAFGVILINTKQGKRGRKPQITYDNNFSFSQLIGIPKEVSSLEYVNMWNEAALNSGSSPIYPADQIQRVKDYLAGTLKTETQPNATGTDWINGQLGNANNHWFDILFRDWGFNQQHNLGLSGGSSNVNYYLGAGYNHKQGMYSYGNDDYKLYNIRANLGVDVTRWMKFNLRSSFSRSNFNTPYDYPARTGGGLGGYMHQAARVAPVVPLYNPDGYLSNFSDPAWMKYGGRTIENEDQANLTGEFVVNPFTGFNFTANYSLFSYNTDASNHGKTFYIPRPDGSLAPFGVNPSTFNRTFGKTNNQVVNVFASYEQKFGEHNFKVLGGYLRRFNESLSLSATNSKLYTENLQALSLTYNDKPVVTDAIGQLATEGYFGRINYNYKEKYLVEFDGRYDATSRFITDRWQMYPGVSAGYVLSKENYWKKLADVVNNFKLRASYGKSGDQASLSLYPFYQSMVTTIPPNTNWFFGSGRQAAVSAPGVVNPNITWQKPVMIDVGMDASFLRYRLSVSFDWYKRTMKDMIVASAPLPAVFGTTPPTTNNGEMQTRGFEFTTMWNDRIGQLKYSVRAALSDYTGKVTKYPNPTKILSDWFTGESIGNIYGYTSVGLYANDADAAQALPYSFSGQAKQAGDVIYMDLDKSGRIDNGKNTADSMGDLRVIGNSTPRYAYSLDANVDWKQFDLSVFVQGVAKRDLWIGNNYFWGIIGDRFQSSFFTVHRNRWTPDNPNGYYPKFYMTGGGAAKNEQVQTRYLQNGAYLRIKNVQLGYSLPPALMNRWHMNKIRVYVSAENLFTITKMVKTLDPEIAATDAGNGTGKVYPLQRTFSFGINVGL